MPVNERQLDALEIWPSADELSQRLAFGGLVLLPDDVSEVEGETVASFREAAQPLRVGAKEAGLPVELVCPPGARLGVYRERAAEWVLPYAASIADRSPAPLSRSHDDFDRLGLEASRSGRRRRSRHRRPMLDCKTWHRSS